MNTSRGPINDKEKDKKKITFCYGKVSLLIGIRTGGGGEMVATFSTTPLRVVEKSLELEIRGPSVRVINEKVIYRVIKDSFGLNFGTPFAMARKRRLFGLFGTRRLRPTNEEQVVHRHSSSNNAYFASSIQVSLLNTSFRIVYKLEGLAVGNIYHA